MRVEEQQNMETRAETRREPAARGTSRRRPGLFALLALALVVAVVVAGILPRVRARTALRRETAEMAVPAVNVVQPRRSSRAQELVLPGNVQAFKDAPIYARTNGYLKRWYVDLGQHVKAGQLLAEIDTPEVDQQLRQARAELGTAQANLRLAQITAERYSGLLKTDSVSKQEADNAAGDYAAKQAMVRSAEANVKRLEEVKSWQRIYAPFDGVISARNTDIGALIDSGSAGGVKNELFHIVQPGRLRVYINVPEAYSQAARPGMAADLTLSEFPGRRFQGKLVRTADAIDPATRTLLGEVDVDNSAGTLKPGAYTEVHLNLPAASDSYILPVNTLLFRAEGLRVAAVGPGGQVTLREIKLGHDFGNSVEVVSGLRGNEQVIVNPPDSLTDGERVTLVSPGQAGEASANSQPE